MWRFESVVSRWSARRKFRQVNPESSRRWGCKLPHYLQERCRAANDAESASAVPLGCDRSDRRLPIPAEPLKLHTKLAVFNFRLKNLGSYCRIVRFAGVYVKRISMPWTNDRSVFKSAFAKRAAFMRASAVQHANLTVDVGNAQWASPGGDFENEARLG